MVVCVKIRIHTLQQTMKTIHVNIETTITTNTRTQPKVKDYTIESERFQHTTNIQTIFLLFLVLTHSVAAWQAIALCLLPFFSFHLSSTAFARLLCQSFSISFLLSFNRFCTLCLTSFIFHALCMCVSAQVLLSFLTYPCRDSVSWQK